LNKRSNKKLDSSGVGFLSGFLMPVIIFFAVYLFQQKDVSFRDYIAGLWHLNALVKLGSLCVFANLLIFSGFIRLKYDRAARGVLGATILYALAVLITKTF
jgi:hypothetical protein